jgi:hypothetical protein
MYVHALFHAAHGIHQSLLVTSPEAFVVVWVALALTSFSTDFNAVVK